MKSVQCIRRAITLLLIMISGEEFVDSLKNTYQNNLRTKMRGSEFD